MRVYHFVSTTFGISNIALNRLRVSRFSQLNDPFELLATDMTNNRHKEALDKFKAEMDKNKGIICFSGTWHNPLLWGHYADKHKGIALGFDIPDEFLLKVRYTSNRAQIKYDEKKRHIVGGVQVLDKLVRTKFIDWKYEDESRMYVELDAATVEEDGNYFINFSEKLHLKEIILGIKCDLPIERVNQLISNSSTGIKIYKSRLANKAFKII
jgi:hypothetical protein